MTSMDLLKSTGMLTKIQAMVKQQAQELPITESISLVADTNNLVHTLCKRMDEIYTQDELYKLVLFYNSELGKALLSKQDQVLAAMTEEMQKFFENFVLRSLAVEEAGALKPVDFN